MKKWRCVARKKQTLHAGHFTNPILNQFSLITSSLHSGKQKSGFKLNGLVSANLTYTVQIVNGLMGAIRFALDMKLSVQSVKLVKRLLTLNLVIKLAGVFSKTTVGGANPAWLEVTNAVLKVHGLMILTLVATTLITKDNPNGVSTGLRIFGGRKQHLFSVLVQLSLVLLSTTVLLEWILVLSALGD